jgi:hypothetical protein
MSIDDTKKRTAIMIGERTKAIIKILEEIIVETSKYGDNLNEFDADTLDKHWRVELSQAKSKLFNVNELCYLLVKDEIK